MVQHKTNKTLDQESKTSTKNNSDVRQEADQLEIIFYTDPLCCWSWGFEPQWRRLQYEFEGKLNIRYCMGGMLSSWKDYHDEMNSVSRPIQMGPVWMHASQVSGMPMNTRIWMEDAPVSSYPACIAVKSAQLQSAYFGEKYLRLLREAIMLTGKNIAKQDVLVEVAEQLSQGEPAFDTLQFQKDLVNDKGLEAFKVDVQEVQARNIKRFPTLIIKNAANNKAILITGYRPYPVLLEAINQVAPGFTKVHKNYSQEAYKFFWKRITETEVTEGTKEY